MFWGGFGWNGVLALSEISTRMDSQGYTDILTDSLLPEARMMGGRSWIFQQDNAPTHKSKWTTDWFSRNKVRVLDWPARSPDLNPIENLWGIMTRSVYAKGRQYSHVNDLRVAIQMAWNSITLQTLRNLIDSMKNRIFQVIYNRGGFIG
jgi:DDE superfamily endonuclease